MGVSLKCQYGLRALFELAKRERDGYVRLTQIAQAQAIPPRFLENILNQLRQGGFVDSRRGKDGGFTLQRPGREVRVGDVIRFIEGPVSPVDCGGETPSHKCPLKGGCVFMAFWMEAKAALEAVYDRKTLADLVEDEARAVEGSAESYCI